MKNRYFWIGVLIGLALTGGCVENPVSTSSTNNPNVPVDKLLVHDGCTVYRFADGNYHYFVKCDNGSASTTDERSCGKSCTFEESIPTTVPTQRF